MSQLTKHDSITKVDPPLLDGGRTDTSQNDQYSTHRAASQGNL